MPLTLLLRSSETLAPVCEHETLSGGDTRWGGGGGYNALG